MKYPNFHFAIAFLFLRREKKKIQIPERERSPEIRTKFETVASWLLFLSLYKITRITGPAYNFLFFFFFLCRKRSQRTTINVDGDHSWTIMDHISEK